ncbi:MoaD/ThiS family protein [Novosphingobium sp. PS1R-30]|uniref:MoaD/ThiS family protein n=1 Tax=Novosphingobium anseongense TaxID=3133436 RepID=A0ABU8RZW9_9SPHN|nr:MAG: MoaD/ThiS family protein [Novosphingobium sp.]
MAKLVFLGRLEDLAGAAEREVSDGPLTAVLAALEPELAEALVADRIRLALNGVLLVDRSGIVLAPSDELAFLPPVSGG